MSADERDSLRIENDLLKEEVSSLRRRMAELKRQLEDALGEHNTPAEVKEIFEYWQQKCDHPQAKLDSKRRRKITARLREGYTVAYIKEAIDGAAADAYVNQRGKRFDDIELICRNAPKLEDFHERRRRAGGDDKLLGQAP